ncbi:MAG: type II secretion system F family protein [Fimbriimonadaceae bacterium]
MPVFEYSGVDGEGKTIRGHMVGESLDMVSRRLADQGLQVNQLGLASGSGDPLTEAPRTVSGSSSPSGTMMAPPPSARIDAPPTEARTRLQTDLIGPTVGGVSLSKLQFFFRQLGTMLNAGIEVRQALDTLAHQSGEPLKAILFETRDHVAAGRPMSAGFQRYPEVFSPLMMSMVRAGEKGGMVGDQCVRLSDYIQRDIELRNLVRRETMYPKLVFIFSVGIILATNFIINVVAPGKSGINAPGLIWFVVSIGVVAVFVFRKYLMKQPAVKHSWDQFLISVPYVGNMVHGFAMAMFGRAFGTLYEAGLPLSESLKLGADSCNNEAVRAKIYPVVNRLNEGAGVHETFVMSGAFSPIVLDMVKTGELTGNMNEMMQRVAEFYEDEGQTKAKQAASIYGLTMLVVVGIYVAYVVISFYMGFASDRMSGLGE